MAVWLVRAGGHGEFEQKFVAESRVYVTWDDLAVDLSKLPDREALRADMASRYPEQKPKAILNWASQVWPFCREMKKGDLVVLPLKSQPAIQIGEIDGDYHFEPKGPNPFFHWRPVKWVGEAIPRSRFGQDLRYSLGAFLTICRIQKNNAEARLLAMRASGWKPESAAAITAPPTPSDLSGGESAASETNLEELAQDQIASLIEARFKGHHFTRLVAAVLQAQGYTTYVSPEGADGGSDILAGAGPLGFGSPRLCVEVKSQQSPIDRRPSTNCSEQSRSSVHTRACSFRGVASRSTSKRNWLAVSSACACGHARSSWKRCLATTTSSMKICGRNYPSSGSGP